LNMTSADLLLSTISGFAPHVGDLFFLVINDGGTEDPTTGQFGALNGVAGTLAEGSTLNFGGAAFTLTYGANFDALAFTGGNDIALQVQSVPEPGTWAMML